MTNYESRFQFLNRRFEDLEERVEKFERISEELSEDPHVGAVLTLIAKLGELDRENEELRRELSEVSDAHYLLQATHKRILDGGMSLFNERDALRKEVAELKEKFRP